MIRLSSSVGCRTVAGGQAAGLGYGERRGTRPRASVRARRRWSCPATTWVGLAAVVWLVTMTPGVVADEERPGPRPTGNDEMMRRLDRIANGLERLMERLGPPEERGPGGSPEGRGRVGPPREGGPRPPWGPPGPQPPEGGRPEGRGRPAMPERPPMPGGPMPGGSSEMRERMEEAMREGRERMQAAMRRMEEGRQRFEEMEQRVRRLEEEVERLRRGHDEKREAGRRDMDRRDTDKRDADRRDATREAP